MEEENNGYTLEELHSLIRGMRDCAREIEDKVLHSPSVDVIDSISRQVSYLSLMLAKDEIINSGEDLTNLQSALQLGADYLENNL